MAKLASLLLLALFLSYAIVGLAADEFDIHNGRGKQEEEEEGYEKEKEDMFLLQESKHVLKTEAGEMRIFVTPPHGGLLVERPLHIGFLTMEPKTLFIPQYLDSSLIIFIRGGEARVGTVYKDDMVERHLKMGDVFRIEGGSTFYLINMDEGQRLHVICSLDPNEGLGFDTFQAFLLAGHNSVLAGFDKETLAAAFNLTKEELKDLMTSQSSEPIVYLTDHSPSMWKKFVQLKAEEKLEHLRRVIPSGEDEEDIQELEQTTWSWRKLLNSVFPQKFLDNVRKKHRKLDSYNLYKRTPDFKNNYGWSLALEESDYRPLRKSGVGIFYVNLTAGSMMAPHVNPRATEFSIVLRGSGSIQIVYPNGTSAASTQVKEGDVFFVPRYFPFCQIASRSGPMEFFGFTTSARKNRPQFLVGASSILHTMEGPELAAAFGMTEKHFRHIANAQREGVILPSPSAAPPDVKGKQKMPRTIYTNLFRFD
ncbi:Cupin 1 [Dillenia turbinata]|uniref:Cupin 1 n=1 Tax=Dillenia turbinata TaxID=194707 RepID=A0AAN8VFU5_9MAGN